MAIATPLEFAGSTEQQALAQRTWELIITQATLHAHDAQIKQSLENVAAFIAQQDNVEPDQMAQQIDAAIQANPAIFGRETRDDMVLISTSRLGNATSTLADNTHTFAQRLYEPRKPLATDDISNVVTTVRPPLTTVEPVQISGYWRTLVSQPSAPSETIEDDEPTVELEPTVIQVPEAAEAAPQPEVVISSMLRLGDGTQIDLALPVEDLMREAGPALMNELDRVLDNDPLRRVVSFGPWRYLADALPGFGKNDLRRIREYIGEQGQPTTDVDIASDMYRERPGTPSFDVFCFGLNQRLSREKEFEFVGTLAQRQWSAKGLPNLGSKRIKASDLGPFYAHLTEGFDTSTPAQDGQMTHFLSVFEWEYGLLPLNSTLAALIPDPLLPDQQSVVVRVETPQQFGVVLAEVRYPRPNRGGWLWGLEDFFHESLVPGTLITLAQGNDGNLVLTYEEVQGVEDRLLHLEEKRNRYVFLPITYYVAVDDDLLPNQQRYPKLRNLKALPMSERRKFDVVLEHVFETVGEQLGTKQEPLYWLQLSELLLAINVLRPTNAAYLEHILQHSPAFTVDEATPGAYYFKPAPSEVAEDDPEEQPEEEVAEEFDTFDDE